MSYELRVVAVICGGCKAFTSFAGCVSCTKSPTANSKITDHATPNNKNLSFLTPYTLHLTPTSQMHPRVN